MKKGFLALLVFSMVFFTLSASGKQEPVPESKAAPVIVRIQGYGGQDPAIVVRLLEEVIGSQLKGENINLVYEPIEGDYNGGLFNALSAGTAGDIVYIPVETAPGIIATGQILPLNGMIDTDVFVDSLISAYTFDHKIYGIPKDFNTLALYYNKDLFDEAGVAYPGDKETWASISDKARKISHLADDVYGIAFQPAWDRFGAFVNATGWEQFDDKGKTNLLDKRFSETFSWYTDLIREGAAVVPGDLGQGWTGGAFATENVGMAMEGAWMIGFLSNDAPNIPYGTAFLPSAPNGEKGNFLYTVAYGINKNTKNKDAALKVLKALTGEAAQQFILENGLAIPSRKALADNAFFEAGTRESEANKTIFLGAEMGYVRGYQFGSVGTEWMQPINTAISAVVSGENTVNSALKTAQNEMNELTK